MELYTLDHNVIIDLENKNEPLYTHICQILAAHFNQCAITAVSASENPKIDNINAFLLRIRSIPELKRIQESQILKPMGISDFTFWDWSIWGDGSGLPMVQLKENITSELFPNLYPITFLDKKVRNKLADIMAFWCHVYYERTIFITNDDRFHKKSSALENIAQNYHGTSIKILRPQEISL